MELLKTSVCETGNSLRRVAEPSSPKKGFKWFSFSDTSGRKFTCDACGSEFVTNFLLKLHRSTQCVVLPYACNKCDLRFASRPYLLHHSRIHRNTKNLKNSKNNFIFGLSVKSDPDESFSSETIWFKCDSCELSFSGPSKLLRHKRIHNKKKSFRCEKCNLGFNWKSNLNRHLKTKCVMEALECNESNRTFGRKYNLFRHLTGHKKRHLNRRKSRPVPKSRKMQTETNGNHGICKEFDTVETNLEQTLIIPKEENIDQTDSMPQSNLQENISELYNNHREYYEVSKSYRANSFSNSSECLHPSRRKNLALKRKATSNINAAELIETTKADEPPINIKTNAEKYKKSKNLYKVAKNINQKRYECVKCELNFQWKSELMQHQRTHTDVKPFLCDHCDLGFNWKSNLVRHQNRFHYGKISFKCDECSMGFVKKFHLSQHMKIHVEEDSSAENLNFSMKGSNLVKSESNEADLDIKREPGIPSPQSNLNAKKSTTSPRSNFVVKSEINLSKFKKGSSHQKNKTGENPKHNQLQEVTSSENLGKYKQCNFAMNTDICQNLLNVTEIPKETQQSEIKELPSNPNTNASCGIPKPQHFPTTRSRNKRIKSEELELDIQIDSQQYPCSKCDRVFKRKSSRLQHEKSHDRKPFKCEVCMRIFARKSVLTRHYLIHTGEKPFRCEVCFKFFRQKSQLTQHLQMHSVVKPHNCETCLRQFNRKSILARHRTIHSGERPFQCATCLLNFNEKSIPEQHQNLQKETKPIKVETCSFNRVQKLNLDDLKQNIHTNVNKFSVKCEKWSSRYLRRKMIQQREKLQGEKPAVCHVYNTRFSLKRDLQSQDENSDPEIIYDQYLHECLGENYVKQEHDIFDNQTKCDKVKQAAPSRKRPETDQADEDYEYYKVGRGDTTDEYKITDRVRRDHGYYETDEDCENHDYYKPDQACPNSKYCELDQNDEKKEHNKVNPVNQSYKINEKIHVKQPECHEEEKFNQMKECPDEQQNLECHAKIPSIQRDNFHGDSQKNVSSDEIKPDLRRLTIIHIQAESRENCEPDKQSEKNHTDLTYQGQKYSEKIGVPDRLQDDETHKGNINQIPVSYKEINSSDSQKSNEKILLDKDLNYEEAPDQIFHKNIDNATKKILFESEPCKVLKMDVKTERNDHAKNCTINKHYTIESDARDISLDKNIHTCENNLNDNVCVESVADSTEISGTIRDQEHFTESTSKLKLSDQGDGNVKETCADGSVLDFKGTESNQLSKSGVKILPIKIQDDQGVFSGSTQCPEASHSEIIVSDHNAVKVGQIDRSLELTRNEENHPDQQSAPCVEITTDQDLRCQRSTSDQIVVRFEEISIDQETERREEIDLYQDLVRQGKSRVNKVSDKSQEKIVEMDCHQIVAHQDNPISQCSERLTTNTDANCNSSNIEQTLLQVKTFSGKQDANCHTQNHNPQQCNDKSQHTVCVEELSPSLELEGKAFSTHNFSSTVNENSLDHNEDEKTTVIKKYQDLTEYEGISSLRSIIPNESAISPQDEEILIHPTLSSQKETDSSGHVKAKPVVYPNRFRTGQLSKHPDKCSKSLVVTNVENSSLVQRTNPTPPSSTRKRKESTRYKKVVANKAKKLSSRTRTDKNRNGHLDVNMDQVVVRFEDISIKDIELRNDENVMGDFNSSTVSQEGPGLVNKGPGTLCTQNPNVNESSCKPNNTIECKNIFSVQDSAIPSTNKYGTLSETLANEACIEYEEISFQNITVEHFFERDEIRFEQTTEHNEQIGLLESCSIQNVNRQEEIGTGSLELFPNDYNAVMLDQVPVQLANVYPNLSVNQYEETHASFQSEEMQSLQESFRQIYYHPFQFQESMRLAQNLIESEEIRTFSLQYEKFCSDTLNQYFTTPVHQDQLLQMSHPPHFNQLETLSHQEHWNSQKMLQDCDQRSICNYDSESNQRIRRDCIRKDQESCLNINNSVKQFACENCNQFFKRKEDLIRHRFTVHQKNRRF